VWCEDIVRLVVGRRRDKEKGRREHRKRDTNILNAVSGIGCWSANEEKKVRDGEVMKRTARSSFSRGVSINFKAVRGNS
jgi:hypothetical protein